MSESPVTLILGASGGVGSSVARKLHAVGHRLVLGARRPDACIALALETEASTCTVEASDPVTFDSAVAAALTAHGRLDHVVNAIGSIFLKPVHLTTASEWNEVISTHLGSAFHTLRAAVPALLKHRGSVVLFSSAAARVGLANHEAISAAKAGIGGLVLAAAASYASRGVRVNAVAPGLLRTQASARLLSSEAGQKASNAMHPMGRIGEPDEIASLVTWLLSTDATWVTGQCFGIDGGLGTVRPK